MGGPNSLIQKPKSKVSTKILPKGTCQVYRGSTIVRKKLQYLTLKKVVVFGVQEFSVPTFLYL